MSTLWKIIGSLLVGVVAVTGLWVVTMLQGVLGWLGGGLVLVVAVTGLWAAIAMLEWVIFKFFPRIWFRVFINRSPTYKDIVDVFESRLKALEEGEEQLADKDLGEKVRELAGQVNTQYAKLKSQSNVPPVPVPAQNAPVPAQTAPVPAPTYNELGRTLRDIMKQLAELEADRLIPPPSTADRRAFRNDELYKRTWEEMADRRYLGVWGNYDPRDARNSAWRVIEANRFITKGQAKADARREKWLASSAIFLAFVTGFVAIGVAVLAIPTKESIFCQTGIPERLPLGWGACDKGPDKPGDASSRPY